MSWFKLDDTFGAHPKVIHAGNAATGLWVRCATYSAQYLLDGHIPYDVARRYGKPSEIQTLLGSNWDKDQNRQNALAIAQAATAKDLIQQVRSCLRSSGTTQSGGIVEEICQRPAGNQAREGVGGISSTRQLLL